MNHLIMEQQSHFDMEQTVEKIMTTAQSRGWNVPYTHDLQQSLEKSGKQVKPVKVIEICKPEFSGKMLELNHERVMSVMMPCRIAVYLKDDGKTYVSYLNSSAMAQDMPAVVKDALNQAYNDMLEVIKQII